MLCLVSQLCPTLSDPMDCSPPSSSVHGDSPGRNTRVGCYVILQGIFPTQGLIGSPTLQVDSLPFEPPGKPGLIVMHLLIHYEFNYVHLIHSVGGFPGGSEGKVGNGPPPQHSCLENPTDGEAW